MSEHDNPPAFPVKVKRATSSDPLAMSREVQLEGMTLRDWFAGQALAGMLASGPYAAMSMAADAYDYADAMLAVRKA